MIIYAKYGCQIILHAAINFPFFVSFYLPAVYLELYKELIQKPTDQLILLSSLNLNFTTVWIS